MQLLDLVFGESPAVPHGHVPLHVSDGAHAGDDGRDGRVAQDVAKGYLRDLVLRSPELGDDGPDPVLDLMFAITPKVVVAEVALLEGGVWCDPTRKGTLVEGDPDDDANAVLPASGQ